MEALTEKQQRVLAFIESRLQEGKPPSQREIARHFHLAQNAVYQLIRYLRAKGYLIDSGGHRGLRLSSEYLDGKKQTQGVPIVGRVAAGEPILAEENVEGYADLNEFLDLREDVFLLKISGDSMIDEGIMDGDYVAVQPADKIENGRIGVVLLEDEATVKKIYIQRDRIALQPANKAAGYKTRYVKRGNERVRIVGKVIGCIRKM